jgi:chromosome partitioning protein
MKTLAFFNNKGGVGKTSLVYHLSWMFAELGVNVVAIDLDPQSNLTASFLEDEKLIELWDAEKSRQTILGLIQPLLNRLGDISPTDPLEVDPRISLIPGDLGLSLFEDRLAETWGKCLDDNLANASDAFRVTTAFYRIMEDAARRRNAKLVLIDVGPNLGAINRAALVSADHVVIPLAADLFSLQGLRNLGPTLYSWRKGWETRKNQGNGLPNLNLNLPSGNMKPAGYVVMQPSVRENYPVAAYRRWIDRIPEVHYKEVLRSAESGGVPNPDPMALATLKNYRSLAPMAQEAHKPMFALKPADGAIGGHAAAVQASYRAFRDLAERIATACEFSLPSRPITRRQEIVATASSDPIDGP